MILRILTLLSVSVKVLSVELDLCNAEGTTLYANYTEEATQTCGCTDARRCIRKCCQLGYSLHHVEDAARGIYESTNLCYKRENFTANFSVPVFSNYTKLREESTFLVGMLTCNRDEALRYFKLNDKDPNEKYYLQGNGSLFYPHSKRKFYLNDRYCVDEKDGLSVYLCFTQKDRRNTLRQFNSIGMIISTPFLLITFIVYFVLPERNIHRRALMSYVFTLLIAYITLVTIQLYTGQFPDVACHILGHLIIFFFLVSFFWMNVMCIDMWLAFSGMRTVLSKQTAERKRFIIYCVYAWGVPTLHTIIVFLINTYGDPDASYYPGIGKRRCFLGEELPTFYYFYLPMAILIGINIILFIATTVRIQRIKRETKMLKHSESKRHSYEDDKQKFNLYLKLMFAMGVNWTMELVSWAVDWKVKETPTFIWYLTDFTNAMYGLLIFMIFVFKKKIWKSLQKRYYVFVGKPHLAHTMTQSSGLGTRTSNYSTTETNLNSDYRLNEMRNSKPEESGLTAA